MSTATLYVWVTSFGDPCHIEDKESSYVDVLDCEGNVVRLCGRSLAFLPANCGHAEIEAPPGCYAVFAGHSARGEGIGPFRNRLTHVQIVRVNCGDHAGVPLFSPSLWFCGTWFAYAVETELAALRRADIDPKPAGETVETVNALLERLPVDAFAANTRKALEEEPREAS